MATAAQNTRATTMTGVDPCGEQWGQTGLTAAEPPTYSDDEMDLETAFEWATKGMDREAATQLRTKALEVSKVMEMVWHLAEVNMFKERIANIASQVAAAEAHLDEAFKTEKQVSRDQWRAYAVLETTYPEAVDDWVQRVNEDGNGCSAAEYELAQAREWYATAVEELPDQVLAATKCVQRWEKELETRRLQAQAKADRLAAMPKKERDLREMRVAQITEMAHVMEELMDKAAWQVSEAQGAKWDAEWELRGAEWELRDAEQKLCDAEAALALLEM